MRSRPLRHGAETGKSPGCASRLSSPPRVETGILVKTGSAGRRVLLKRPRSVPALVNRLATIHLIRRLRRPGYPAQRRLMKATTGDNQHWRLVFGGISNCLNFGKDVLRRIRASERNLWHGPARPDLFALYLPSRQYSLSLTHGCGWKLLQETTRCVHCGL